MDGTLVQEVHSHKHLGLVLTSWKQHVDELLSKVNSRLFILNKLKFKLDRLSLKTLYLSFIRPLMEYVDVNLTDEYIKKLVRVNIEAARIEMGQLG